MSVKYISPAQWAKRHKRTKARAQRYLVQGRVPGAIRIGGGGWAIPADAPWPATSKKGGRPKKSPDKSSQKLRKSA